MYSNNLIVLLNFGVMIKKSELSVDIRTKYLNKLFGQKGTKEILEKEGERWQRPNGQSLGAHSSTPLYIYILKKTKKILETVELLNPVQSRKSPFGTLPIC